MGKEFPSERRIAREPRLLGMGISVTLALVLVTLLVQSLMANGAPANLDGSTKAVNRPEAFPGQKVEYSIVISNSGDLVAPNVVMTDAIPSGVALDIGSLTQTLTAASAVQFGEANGVISWTGVISGHGSVIIDFHGTLTDSLHSGDLIQNTVWITGTGSLITKTATTTVITSTSIYLPVIMKPVPVPRLNAVMRTTSNNQWTVSWSDEGSGITGYQVQESGDMAFTSPASPVDAGLNLSHDFNPAESTKNLYCYRARALVNALVSAWSNVECVYGNYYDDFSDPSTGWAIRRQDTDDVNNDSYYQNGYFVTKIRGRWDYALAAPMARAPRQSYEIETMVKFEGGVDNLHTYGIVFGGDWNGQPCPNGNYSSCFNHYYRLMVIWYGAAANSFRVDLKRIDFHDPNDNTGQGTDKLISFKDHPVANASGWNKWNIKVFSNGLIQVYVNGGYVGGGIDPTYVASPYFGVFAASNEYSGTEPWYDYFSVRALP